MKQNGIVYRETHFLQLNIYLYFYLYVFAIFIFVNLFPALTINYFLFLILGIIGISIFFMKFTYSILVKEDIIVLSMRIPFKVTLLKLKFADIEQIEEVKTNSSVNTRLQPVSKSYITYFFEKKSAIKLTMLNGKVYIISGFDTSRIIRYITPVKN